MKIAALGVFVLQESVAAAAAAASHGGEVRARANGGKGSVRLAQEPAGAGAGSAAVLRSHAERAHGVHRGRHTRVCPGELRGRAAGFPNGRGTGTWLYHVRCSGRRR